MELLFMWKCLLQFLEKRKCSISGSYYGKIFYQNIMDGSKVTILNLLGKDKAGGDTGYDRTPPSMGDALPPARSQVSYQLCRGDPLPSACVMS